jgi:hypothetical protein
MTARDATIAVSVRGGAGRRPMPAVRSRGVAWHIGYLEGRHVRVTLTDGSRIDDCELVSAGHHGAESLWVCADGADIFVPLADVTDVREVIASAPDRFP